MIANLFMLVLTNTLFYKFMTAPRKWHICPKYIGIASLMWWGGEVKSSKSKILASVHVEQNILHKFDDFFLILGIEWSWSRNS